MNQCVQAEEMRGECLGRKGGPELEFTQHRALLQHGFGMTWLMASGEAQGQENNRAPPSPPPRDTPDERGQGKTRSPSERFAQALHTCMIHTERIYGCNAARRILEQEARHLQGVAIVSEDALS